MAKKKTKKSLTGKKKAIKSPLLLYWMERMRRYLQDPSINRKERTDRAKRLAKKIERDVVTLKNMYLYGQGRVQQWADAMDEIDSINQ